MTIQPPLPPTMPPTGQPPVSLLSPNPLGVGDLIDRSFRLYRRHFKAFIFMAAVLLLPYGIISGFFTQSMMQNQLVILQQVLTQQMTDPAAIEQQITQLSNMAGFAGFSFVLSLVGAALYLLTYLGLITLVIRTLHGESATLGDGFAGARRNFWATIRLGILFILIFLGIGLVVALAFGVVAAVGGGLLGAFSSSTGDSDSIIIALIAFCCIIPLAFLLIAGPFIYVAARWSVVMPALVHNQAGARRSMGISWNLSKGKVWRIIGYFALIYLLTVVIFLLPTYMILFGSVLLVGMDLVWLSSLLSTLFNVVLTTLWLPLTAILPTMLYFDLRTRANLASGGTASSSAITAYESPSLAGQPSVSTPPYVGPTWAPASPPSAPASPSTPTETPSSWSQNDEPDDPWASPPNPPSGDKS